ncbi:hypothetical protein AVEN_186041-1 [Araneus ventricosus]|uniref:Uncharacterized protein n=1 Tax=Araneus ventricosus TaxID=182803 RepID=A0A4Y2UG39_ARAVE|nr:hypothetical protein AVEN_186041-1 [Araneus ventricosus]
MIIPCTSLVTVNRVTPVLPRHIGRCNRSSTQTGVVVTITDHGPTSPEGGMYYHWREVSCLGRLVVCHAAAFCPYPVNRSNIINRFCSMNCPVMRPFCKRH